MQFMSEATKVIMASPVVACAWATTKVCAKATAWVMKAFVATMLVVGILFMAAIWWLMAITSIMEGLDAGFTAEGALAMFLGLMLVAVFILVCFAAYEEGKTPRYYRPGSCDCERSSFWL